MRFWLLVFVILMPLFVHATEPLFNKNNYHPEYFKNITNLRLSEEEIKKMYTERMLESIKNIRTHIPNFDNLGVNTQDVIMDMMYDMGNTDFSKLSNFINYAKNNDILGMINECNRPDVPQSRNDWAREKLWIDLRKQLDNVQ